MSYHGTQDAAANPLPVHDSLASTIDVLDAADSEHGLAYAKLSGVRKARTLLERGEALRANLRGRREAAAADVEALAARYVTETSTTKLGADLLDAAVLAASLTDDVLDDAGRHLDVAARSVYAAWVAELRKVTEEDWVAPLRPLVAAVLEEANRYADAIGITQPHAAQQNTRTTQHAWSPSRVDLEHRELRHAWENLGATLERLDDLHAIVTALRYVGLVPLVPGRDWCEDYRWLTLDTLVGKPEEQREFYLANRGTGGPGIYTSAELTAGTLPVDRREGVEADPSPSWFHGHAVAAF